MPPGPVENFGAWNLLFMLIGIAMISSGLFLKKAPTIIVVIIGLIGAIIVFFSLPAPKMF